MPETPFRSNAITVTGFPTSFANIVYVDPLNGDDVNSGLEAFPVRTLDKGVEFAKPTKATVKCMAGTVAALGATLPSDIGNLTIEGATQELFSLAPGSFTVVVDASGSYSTITMTSDPGWAVNAYRGEMLKKYYQTPGNYETFAPVISNTSNTLTVVGYAGTIYTMSVHALLSKIVYYTGGAPGGKRWSPTSEGWHITKFRFEYGASPSFGTSPIRMLSTMSSCYFKRTGNQTAIYPSGVNLYNCLSEGFQVGYGSLDTTATYCAVVDATSFAAFRDMRSLSYCSAWNCLAFYATYWTDPARAATKCITAAGGNVNSAFINYGYSFPERVLLNNYEYVTLNRTNIVLAGYSFDLTAIKGYVSGSLAYMNYGLVPIRLPNGWELQINHS